MEQLSSLNQKDSLIDNIGERKSPALELKRR